MILFSKFSKENTNKFKKMEKYIFQNLDNFSSNDLPYKEANTILDSLLIIQHLPQTCPNIILAEIASLLFRSNKIMIVLKMKPIRRRSNLSSLLHFAFSTNAVKINSLRYLKHLYCSQKLA